jgi:hypothetical protein
MAASIFGPDIGSLKGKTVQQTPDTVTTHIISILPDIWE